MSVPQNKPLRAVIWCAVSSKSQAGDDKISLEVQEREARAWCSANNYGVVAVLKVPGYSRRESDIITALDDFAEQGIYAYHQIREMWQHHEFDIMVAYAHDRLGRSNTLHSWVVENVILSGAQIYLLADGGYVDLDDFRYKLAIGGMMAAAPIDRFIKARQEGMKARAQRGLPVSSRIPISHVLIRDPQTGRGLRLEVNEQKRQLWDDLATLILEGVAWFRVEYELFERFGHGDDNGNPLYPNFMYKLVMKPIFWGHTAQHHNSTNVPNGFKLGQWVYDESVPIPEGATIYRNTHQPVYTGELAEQIKAELMRRSEVIRGNAKPGTTHRYTGLVICGECGSVLAKVADRSSTYRGMICKSASTKRPSQPDCHNGKVINQKKITAYLDAALRQFVGNELAPFLEEANNQDLSITQRVNELNADIKRIEKQIATLIREQSAASEEVQPFYRTEIDQLNRQHRRMKNGLLELQQKAAALQRANAAQQAARKEITELTVDGFWKQENRVINQMLHRLMGKRKLVVLGGEIVGTSEKLYRNRRTKPTNRASQE